MNNRSNLFHHKWVVASMGWRLFSMLKLSEELGRGDISSLFIKDKMDVVSLVTRIVLVEFDLVAARSVVRGNPLSSH
jgi:hypothetical protein